MSTKDFTEAALTVSPMTVLVRVVIERAFPPGIWELLYKQHTPKDELRKLTISSIVGLMIQVVSGARRSLFAAFRADQGSPEPKINASHQALYGKVGRIEPDFCCAIVRHSAERLAPVIDKSGVKGLCGWHGYRIRMIDGTLPNGTQHRLKVLRTIRAAGLPCRLVVAYDPATELCTDAVASEDAYTSEQVLVGTIFERAEPKDLFVTDRHYATAKLFRQVQQRRAYFVIREHQPQMVLKDLRPAEMKGRVETGEVWQQQVEVTDAKTQWRMPVRRVIIKLDAPTQDGDTEIRLLTNLPGRAADAKKIARLYRKRWTIECHFNFIKHHLNGEIESLGRPRASIFAMCLSMVAGNALAVVKCAIGAAHGTEELERLSGYYLADEIEGNYRAIEVLLSQEELDRLVAMPPAAFWRWCERVAATIRIEAFRAHPRGPKKPRPKRASGKHRHHYSTHRLLEEEKQRC